MTVDAAFPSLLISRSALVPEGSFAAMQARFLDPDTDRVAELDRRLRDERVGVVAHFYMDPELQGVLTACTSARVHVADSLAMAGSAVEMASAGARAIVVLGVDFMAENVRATLNAAGYSRVPVYRVSSEPIGCSLAEAAEAHAYGAFLTRASRTPNSLHVIYINTSLRVKAKAHGMVPTLTCTSSNVVRTILQATAQIPRLHVWFGPDTYMGSNLRVLFEQLAHMPSEACAALHPAHTPASIRDVLSRFEYFAEGTCVVHHMFGKQVVDQVRASYGDACITAHLEVPGEMFSLALEAQQEGRGVVGSTSNILAFISETVDRAIAAGRRDRLRFVLGTEAGMVTAIAKAIRTRLEVAGSRLEVEIVFPVASEAITPMTDAELRVVPGAAHAEGCSAAGGCATCPYMKMNSLAALERVVAAVSQGDESALTAYRQHLAEGLVQGRPIAAVGVEPIALMREFQETGRLPDRVVAAIRGSKAA